MRVGPDRAPAHVDGEAPHAVAEPRALVPHIKGNRRERAPTRVPGVRLQVLQSLKRAVLPADGGVRRHGIQEHQEAEDSDHGEANAIYVHPNCVTSSVHR